MSLSNGIKISDFPGIASISGAYFTIISGSTNYKISADDLVTALGVSGTIVSETGGDSAILDDQGSTKVIRMIEAGFGIASAIDANNNVKISTDFSFDPDNVTIVDDVSAAAPAFRSFKAGTGIVVSGTTGEIQISASGTPASTKTVVVAQKSDLPTPSGGIITLLGDTQYLFLDDVSVGTDRMVVGASTVISAADSSLITLTYTGTGAMFTSVNNSFNLKNIKPVAANGSYLDLTGAGAGAENFISRNCIFASCSTFGTITNWGLTIIAEGLSFGAAGSLAFFGTQVRCAINQFSFAGTAGTLVDLGTATFDVIYIAPNVTFNTVVGVTGLNAAASSANINSGGSGVISGCSFLGGGTLTAGLDHSDLLWEITGNRGLENTLKDSLSSNTAGTTVAIAAANTPVLVGGTWVDDNSSQFTVNGDGTVTYNGIGNAHVPITAALTVYPVSGSNKQHTTYVAINGSIITASGRVGLASATDRQSVTPIWQYEFTTGDIVSLMTENNTDTTDLQIDHAVLRVN